MILRFLEKELIKSTSARTFHPDFDWYYLLINRNLKIPHNTFLGLFANLSLSRLGCIFLKVDIHLYSLCRADDQLWVDCRINAIIMMILHKHEIESVFGFAGGFYDGLFAAAV